MIIDLSGYVQRVPSSGGEPQGWAAGRQTRHWPNCRAVPACGQVYADLRQDALAWMPICFTEALQRPNTTLMDGPSVWGQMLGMSNGGWVGSVAHLGPQRCIPYGEGK